MCLLTFFPKGIQPDLPNLYEGADYNRDGHGWAIVEKGELYVFHSMSSEYAIESFAKMRKNHPNGPALFHSRIGTGGSKTVYNCHPFYLGNDRKTVIGHNGILGIQIDKNDPRSDTRVLAEDLIPSRMFGRLWKPSGRELLSEFLGHGNKIVVLTANPKYKEEAYILNEKAGVWDNGIWYSNTSYRPYVPLSTRWSSDGHYYTFSTGSYDYSAICQTCGAVGKVDRYTNRCNWCDTCQDCCLDKEDCLCTEINTICPNCNQWSKTPEKCPTCNTNKFLELCWNCIKPVTEDVFDCPECGVDLWDSNGRQLSRNAPEEVRVTRRYVKNWNSTVRMNVRKVERSQRICDECGTSTTRIYCPQCDSITSKSDERTHKSVFDMTDAEWKEYIKAERAEKENSRMG